MEAKFSDKGFLLRFSSGEDFEESLKAFCGEHRISSATFSGIGQTKTLTLSYWDSKEKQYNDTYFEEELEIVSLTGNVALYNQQLFIHSHGSFGKSDLSTVSGHITQLSVGATLELFLTDLNVTLERTLDEVTGLKLLNI